MSFFSAEIEQAKQKQAEAQQVVSDWHHAQVLCIEIVEMIQGAFPLFLKLGIEEAVKSLIIEKIVDCEAPLFMNADLTTIKNESTESPTNEEIFDAECGTSDDSKLMHPTRVRYAKLFGFNYTDCTPSFVKKRLQNMSSSLIEALQLEQSGKAFWCEVDAWLDRYERYEDESWLDRYERYE